MPYNNPIPERKKSGGLADAMKTYVQVEKIAQIAFVLPSAVLIGWLGGVWLDAKLHQSWMTMTGFILGCIAGFTTTIRMAMDLVKEPKKQPKTDDEKNGKQ